MTKATRKCEGWCEPCTAPATKSVMVKDGVRWFTIRLCDIHYMEFVQDTEPERSTGEIEARF